MDIFFNNVKVSTHDNINQYTLGGLKDKISQWLHPQGYTEYNLVLIFNDNTSLSSEVFNDPSYDNIPLSNYSDLLIGSKLYITPYVSDLERLPKEILQQIIIDNNYGPYDVISLCNSSPLLYKKCDQSLFKKLLTKETFGNSRALELYKNYRLKYIQDFLPVSVVGKMDALFIINPRKILAEPGMIVKSDSVYLPPIKTKYYKVISVTPAGKIKLQPLELQLIDTITDTEPEILTMNNKKYQEYTHYRIYVIDSDMHKGKPIYVDKSGKNKAKSIYGLKYVSPDTEIIESNMSYNYYSEYRE